MLADARHLGLEVEFLDLSVDILLRLRDRQQNKMQLLRVKIAQLLIALEKIYQLPIRFLNQLTDLGFELFVDEHNLGERFRDLDVGRLLDERFDLAPGRSMRQQDF